MAASKLTSTSLSSSIKQSNHLDGICSRISAFYFDLDNTLIPTRIGDSKAIRKLADVLETQYNFNKDDAALATQNFLKAFRRCPDNSQTSLDWWRTHLWRESLQSKHKYLAEHIYPEWLKLRYRYLAIPNDYVQLLLRMRRAGYALALITNGPSKAQWEKVHRLRVRQYFDCVLVSSDLPWEKPHPEIFYAACNFLNVKPNECVMIGDKLETDIKGGYLAQLGLTFWTPLSNSSSATQCLDDVEYKPNIRLNNVLELYKYFPRLNAITDADIANGGGGGAGVGNNVANISGNNVAATTATNRRCSSHTTSTAATSGSNGSSCIGSSSIACTSSGSHQCYRRRQLTYRRGGSLPAIECCNSEAENSCDSFL